MLKHEIRALFWGSSISSRLGTAMKKRGYAYLISSEINDVLTQIENFDVLIVSNNDLSGLFSRNGLPVSLFESKSIIVLGAVSSEKAQPLLEMGNVTQLSASVSLKKFILALNEIKLRREGSNLIQVAISNSIMETIRSLVRQPGFKLDLLLKEIEKYVLIESLILAKSHRKKAATILGISLRSMRYRTIIHQLPKKPVPPRHSLLKVASVQTLKQAPPNPPQPPNTLTILETKSPRTQVVRWRCEKGHEFRAPRTQVEGNSLCPYCSMEWALKKNSA